MEDHSAGIKHTCVVSGRDIEVICLAALRPHGNKYYKLKYNLEFAREQGYTTLASFGGAWSNHLAALAQVGAAQGFSTVGIVRGERPVKLSMMLLDAEAQGMQLHFISRGDYRRRHESEFLAALQGRLTNCLVIPEGGTNGLAVRGTAEIVDEVARLSPAVDLIVLPVGTGGTLAGIAAALRPGVKVLGISVLKGTGAESGLEADVEALIAATSPPSPLARNWSIDHRFHCGGYAKCPTYLQDFILGWQRRHGMLLDPVYTGKLFYGLSQMLAQGEINADTRIVALHTGGEQGRRGYGFLTDEV
ncbi:MAG: pyridoxal-phosphate dependent enzyme [SAR86 cluster bacterium]|uniref:Pyridoxal-phosphate dependent enzyme n=1 Tax=SAR86 cluster bacterium TaxID=2030880 RepID=A0A972VYF1_9GAMM|nr:pyridoxal-phosphate dependent enzyme [SAR86 cluster bacterium]